MKRSTLLLFCFIVFGVFSCATSDADNVRVLSLRDNRLPLDARRWLADTEDEVAIARARVDDAMSRVEILESYLDELKDKPVFVTEVGSGADAETTEEILVEYASRQLELKEAELETALKRLELAKARLIQVRAETAIRHDLAVYEMEPIVEEVEELKKSVAESKTELEDKRASLEKSADRFWKQYSRYVKNGGSTSTFWNFRSVTAW